MRLLIDGYNLLHASDVFGAGDAAGSLRGSREALLDLLATHLPAKLRRATVIVFDAKQAPRGLPDAYEFGGMRVRFARGYPDADTLLEEILASAKGAKQLTVVSGDHRVQRAARSRGAKPVDADAWLTALRAAHPPAPETPQQRGGVGSRQEWIEAFSDPDELAAIKREAAAAPLPRSAADPNAPGTPPSTPPKSAGKLRRKKRRGELRAQDTKADFGAGVFDPFPAGYADDLSRIAERELQGPIDPTNPDEPHDRPTSGPSPAE